MAFSTRPKKPKAFLNEEGLYDYAVKALGRRMRTEAELRRLLSSRAEPGPVGEVAVAGVLARLKERRYLDDQSYAEMFTRLRQENEKFGARRVRQDLRQKGVHSDIIDQAIDARYGESDEEALARKHLERKRIRKPENEKETARVMRRLVAAGFATGTIFKILKQWDVPEESLAALEDVETQEE